MRIMVTSDSIRIESDVGILVQENPDVFFVQDVRQDGHLVQTCEPIPLKQVCYRIEKFFNGPKPSFIT